MDDRTEVLWRMYNEHVTMSRHHETQRSTTSQIILAVVGALIAFYGSTGATDESGAFMSCFVIVLGVFGALFSAKQYERAKFHSLAAGLHRQALEGKVLLNLGRIRSDAEAAHVLLFRRTESWHLHRFWTRLHMLVAAIGVAMLARVLLSA